uniref:Carbohydrate Esterase Family 5 n=2 Tax=Podospora anserina (strain S / ATCC MYA-4624 / DSM 980 / FGSC 10383) TaxID=515849 RepID=A0A090DCA2_PODAN|nr:Putative Carbohydrate Esterase Family 5 [Podospora anserina S mat+]
MKLPCLPLHLHHHHHHLLLLLLLPLTIPSASPLPVTPQPGPCPLLHILSARETTAPPGFGSSITLTQLLLSTFNHSSPPPTHPTITAEAIDYPALGANTSEYAASVTTGTAAVIKRLSTFNALCPETILILHGFSQGGQIIDDALCGVPHDFTGRGKPDEDGGRVGRPLVRREVQRNIAAVVLMGSPRFTGGKRRGEKGTAKVGGFAARPEGFSCPVFDDRMVSFCDEGDPFCSDGEDEEVHGGYGEVYGGEALGFVVERVLVG